MSTPGSSVKAAVVAAAVLALAACTIHQSETPALTGPSGLALSVQVSATPDTVSQDGLSQSAIVVSARDASARAVSSLPVRLDMVVNGVLQDFGTLSARTLVTNADGRASAVFTAPSASPGGSAPSGTVLTIRATPIGSDYGTSLPQSADIRLVPAGVILPPAGTPTASFLVSPVAPTAGSAVFLDASASLAGSNAVISTYSWSFGDGSSGSGRTTSHTYRGSGVYSATLTVTNDRGLSASTTQTVSVAAGLAPTPAFAFSPSAPQVAQTVSFTGELSRAASGHSVASYAWNFGDGATASGVTTTHAFSSAGTFTVVLTVSDDVGLAGSATQAVTVIAGTTALVADFTASPTNPSSGALVDFNASSSSPLTTIASFDWDFGDGTVLTGRSVATVAHTFTPAVDTSFVVRLTVHDTTGRTATTTKTVTVKAGDAPSASFTLSPSPASVGATVTFSGASSAAVAPKTVARYEWDFGDGSAVVSTVAPTSTITHAYAASGTYTIRLTVYDSAGLSTSTSRTLAVQ